jgi:hypothetical protein
MVPWTSPPRHWRSGLVNEDYKRFGLGSEDFRFSLKVRVSREEEQSRKRAGQAST